MAYSELSRMKIVLGVYNCKRFLFRQLNKHNTIENINVIMCIDQLDMGENFIIKMGM